jgi:lipoic acid synthetase
VDDLQSVVVDILTVSQFMQPTKNHLLVKEFIEPKVFAKYKEISLDKGFRFVET